MKDTELIKKRLYSLVNLGTFELFEFLKITEIKFDDNRVNSAAITCTSNPILLLNKEFINNYCKSDEHLFMLLMHELYHLILGHTYLFKCHLLIDNIVFDSLINSLLCKRFNDNKFTSFFINLNDDRYFPSCLLRPIGKNTPIKFLNILKRLYFSNTCTYLELYEIVCKEYKSILDSDKLVYTLLGNHNNVENNNPLIEKIINKYFSKTKESIFNEINDNEYIYNNLNHLKYKTNLKFNLKLQRLFNKAGVDINRVKKYRIDSSGVTSLLPLINYKDRFYFSKLTFYKYPILNNFILNQVSLTNSKKIVIYIDVSGSTDLYVNKMVSLLEELYKSNICFIYQFSSFVKILSIKDIKLRRYNTSFDTSINALFKHYFSLPLDKKEKKIVILTDGFVGELNNEYLNRIKKENIKVFCGLFGEFTNEYMIDYVNYFEEFSNL